MALHRLSDATNRPEIPYFHPAPISDKMVQQLGGATISGPAIAGRDKQV